MRVFWFILLSTFVLVVKTTAAGESDPSVYQIKETNGVVKADAIDEDWWKNSVVYQIYPKSFKDSNNDGTGDLQGIISKLEYLKETGVTVVWLSPIHKSPQVDDGYDISDFKDVDPIFGTLEDFDELVARADELGLKIVMDLVPNHSSNEHPWFALSESRAEGYEDYYVWADANEATGGEPNNWISVFKNSAWKWSETRGQYYLHQFTVEQPDLNYRSEAVVQEMDDVFTFWLDRGVAGFRIDAIPHLFETGLEDEPRSSDESALSYEYAYLDHIYTKDQPETFEMVYHWRELVDKYSSAKGDYSRILMTEAASDITNIVKYYGDEDSGVEGAHFSFNFNLLGTFSSARDLVNSINYWVTYLPLIYTSNWLIGNHDNSRAATRFGPENVDGYNALIALLPGVLVTYNGEEIGQENGEVSYEQCKDPSACDLGEEYFKEHSRDFARTPFQWDNTTNAGFNEGAETWLPVSSQYLQKNLYYQSFDGVKSHYHNYQELLQLRQEPAIISGKLQYVAFSDNVLGLTRTLTDENSYAFVFNINSESETVDLTEGFPSILSQLEVVIASVKSDRNVGDVLDADSVTLDAHESLVFRQIVLEDETTVPSSSSSSEATTESTSSSSSSSSSSSEATTESTSSSSSSSSSSEATTESTSSSSSDETTATAETPTPSTDAPTDGSTMLFASTLLTLPLVIANVLRINIY